MKVLLSWLQEFAPDIAGDPTDLGETMSDLGMAVEDMELIGSGLEGIVVARVLARREHPKADRIQLVDVDAGDGEATQIACGAFNMAVGDLVPLATIGTVMPNGMEIARRKMRGEWSNGMLCSGQEINLGDDHDGILILDPGIAVGTDLRTALGITSDVLYDLEINPNRPDAMSVAGVARDLAARLQVPFALPDPQLSETGPNASDFATVEIVDPDLCGRFQARLLQNVTVGTSPQKLQNRLLALGMRPINSVVDISNYVMLELGHPNHTFDLAKVAGATLRVRMARDGETIETLDGVLRTLSGADGVIADGDDRPLSIAGVMGGASTEISGTTSDVLLEMAWWDPPRIAASSRRLGLRSEASARFERGVDPNVPDLAMRRFAELLAASGTTLAPGVIDEKGKLPEPARVRVRTKRVNEIIGATISQAEIVGYLEPIGFAVEVDGDDQHVTVPSFRPDSTTEIDVIEEVARHHGYSNIERTVPQAVRFGALTAHQRERRRIRRIMTGFGASEAMPVPFVAPGDLTNAGLVDEPIAITNPLHDNESVMRTSLRPGLLKSLAYNASHANHGVWLFEIGHVFRPGRAGEALPDEREYLGVALGGEEAPTAVEAWRLLAESLGVVGELVAGEPAGMHPTRSASVHVDGTAVGLVGEIDPAVLEAHQIAERVAWLEVDLGTILGIAGGEKTYSQVSRFPPSDIDLAFEVDETIPAAAVAATLRTAGGDSLTNVDLFDVYRGEQVGAGRRSLAYALRFRAPDKTLTDAEVAEARSACIAAVEAAHGATLR